MCRCESEELPYVIVVMFSEGLRLFRWTSKGRSEGAGIFK